MRATLIFLILSSSTLFIACSGGSKENIIPKKKMADILLDLNTIESALQQGYYSYNNLDSVTSLELNAVYKFYEVDSADFYRSFTYYNTHPKDLQDIYILVQDKISEEQAEYQID